MKTYDEMYDDERENASVESLRHISREIHTLVDLRGRHRIARAILSNGGPDAVRIALLALDGAPISELIAESPQHGHGIEGA